jgi:hypothetical protein
MNETQTEPLHTRRALHELVKIYRSDSDRLLCPLAEHLNRSQVFLDQAPQPGSGMADGLAR